MREDTLLEAVAALLAHRPAATMEEIAAATGLSRATLFRRYPSRNQLVARVCTEAVTGYAEAVRSARLDEGSAVGALRRLLAGIAPLAARYGMLAMQPLPDLVEAGLVEQAAEADAAVRELIRRGQKDGELRVDVPPAWVLTMLVWLSAGAADALRLGTVAPADVDELLTRTVLDAVVAP